MRVIYHEGSKIHSSVYKSGWFIDNFGDKDLHWSYEVGRNPLGGYLKIMCNGQTVVDFEFGKRTIKTIANSI